MMVVSIRFRYYLRGKGASCALYQDPRRFNGDGILVNIFIELLSE